MEATSVGAMVTRGNASTRDGTRMCKGHPGGERQVIKASERQQEQVT